MIKSISTIVLNTFKESIRDRILLTIAVFVFLLLGSTLFLGSISLDQDSKIIIDFGLFGIFFFGVVITLFVGGASIVKELDQRTAYTILARPIKRSWFILGKFFGLCLTLLVLTLIMSLVFLALVGFKTGWGTIDVALILALFYVYLEFCVLVSLMLLFSSFSSSVMGAVYGIAVFMIGHSTKTIVSLIYNSPAWVRRIFLFVYYIFPNLEKFNLRNDAVYHIRPYASEIALTVGYAVVYCVVLLYLANLAFRKQEL